MSEKHRFKILKEVATADIAFEAYGSSLSELFENSALATTSVMVDANTLSEDIKKDIILRNNEIERLLFDFLNEIIFLKDAEMLLFKAVNIHVKEMQGKFSLNAVLSGEKINREKHNLKIDVKAITLHMFRIEKKKNKYTATVVLDI